MTAPPCPDRVTRKEFDRRDELPKAAGRPYGEGIYRRRIMVDLADHRAWGELEDDFHHFRVEIEHDGTAVTHVDGSGVRSPWTACLDAGQPLASVAGTRLATGPLALSHLDARMNCTHMFDLAGLVVTHAARAVDGRRIYDMAIDDPENGTGARHARLWRDRILVLDWRIEGRVLLSPAEWVDAPLWQGFIPWAARELDDELGEAAVALRRACDISLGRQMDLDIFETAAELDANMAGICHAFQPANAPLAIRRKGSGRDFTDHGELLLADFERRG